MAHLNDFKRHQTTGMNTDKIKQLYQQVILRHDRRPVHFEKREEAPVVIEAYNPICGDRFHLYLEISEGKVAKAAFHGYGCAISKAATSVLVARIEGRPVADILALCQAYLTVLDPAAPEPLEMDEELSAFIGARQFPARRQCAALSWEALEAYLVDGR